MPNINQNSQAPWFDALSMERTYHLTGNNAAELSL
jgi:hypothetical protein